MSMVDDRYRPDSSHERYGSASGRDDEAAGRETVDPLTELARLIGQSDPYADLKSRRASLRLDPGHDDPQPAPGWLARPAPAAYDEPQGYEAGETTDPAYAYRAPASDDQQYAEHAAYEASHEQADDRYADDRHGEPAAQYAEESYETAHHDGRAADDGYDDRYHITPPSGYENDEYYDDGHLPPRGEGEGALSGPRRGGLITIAAVLALAVVGTAGAFAYRAFTGPSAEGPAPVIKADPTPPKGPPATSSADTQDKPVQDRAPGTVQTERIVTREESPVAQPAPPWPAPPRPGSGVTAVAPAPVTPPAPTAVPTTTEPKRVRTLTIRPDANGGDVTQTTPPARPGKQSANAPEAPAPTRTAKAEPPAVANGYMVQLSAQRSEAEAKDSYRALQAKYPAVLGNREAAIRRGDTDNGVYYRVQLGPFATLQSANAFCQELKSAGGQCIVPARTSN